MCLCERERERAELAWPGLALCRLGWALLI